ncbi:hypothetical protein FGB62_20g23 [Gracilaria domingensis]|nr:hypothetical protein FGB62_20g23 [Gracilaria domingensis]
MSGSCGEIQSLWSEEDMEGSGSVSESAEGYTENEYSSDQDLKESLFEEKLPSEEGVRRRGIRYFSSENPLEELSALSESPGSCSEQEYACGEDLEEYLSEEELPSEDGVYHRETRCLLSKKPLEGSNFLPECDECCSEEKYFYDEDVEERFLDKKVLPEDGMPCVRIRCLFSSEGLGCEECCFENENSYDEDAEERELDEELLPEDGMRCARIRCLFSSEGLGCEECCFENENSYDEDAEERELDEELLPEDGMRCARIRCLFSSEGLGCEECCFENENSYDEDAEERELDEELLPEDGMRCARIRTRIGRRTAA